MIEEGRIIHSQTKQIAQLVAERDMYKRIIADRSAMAAVEAVEGLEVLMVRALGGDQGAQLVLRNLIERLDRIRAGLAQIALPNGSS